MPRVTAHFKNQGRRTVRVSFDGGGSFDVYPNLSHVVPVSRGVGKQVTFTIRGTSAYRLRYFSFDKEQNFIYVNKVMSS